jgi:hypothetical protein
MGGHGGLRCGELVSLAGPLFCCEFAGPVNPYNGMPGEKIMFRRGLAPVFPAHGEALSLKNPHIT